MKEQRGIIMNKCFSCAIKSKRRKFDAYATHYSLTEQLLEKHNFDYNNSILEPCCGENKSIVKVLSKKFNNITDYDLAYGEKKDFFNEKSKYDIILTNPPFSCADEFLLKAKQIATKQIIFFLRINFLQGINRYDKIFNKYDNYRLKYVYQFTRMVDMSAPLREDGKYTTAMLSYSWMVWQNGYNGEAELSWINNQKFVLKNGKGKQ
jgi:hypothetical protein